MSWKGSVNLVFGVRNVVFQIVLDEITDDKIRK